MTAENIELIPTKKIQSQSGIMAIKNGLKANANQFVTAGRKPEWIRTKLTDSKQFLTVKSRVKAGGLHTVCEEAMCPNINECWSYGTATFMLLGSVCTRACKFCAVDTGNPKGKLDENEPENTAIAVEKMGLRYVVLTSVNRDDLQDGGAEHYARTVQAIVTKTPKVAVEALVPDFAGNKQSIETLAQSDLLVFAQNMETVQRLTAKVRDPRAGYAQTLQVLQQAKEYGARYTKSSLIVGLGESKVEVVATLKDLRGVGVDIVTLGQYLRPTMNHLPVAEWVKPEQFDEYKQTAEQMGFKFVVSSPMSRSSYRADLFLDKINAN